MRSSPTLSLVVAMDRNRVIGRDGGLPWRLSADLKYFKSITMGKPIVMGRRTHESIGRPLPGRENIVITRDPDYVAPGCRVVHHLDDVLALPAPEVMVIGGASLYADLLPRAQRLYLTEVLAEVTGDTWFPDFDRGDWREISRSDHRADAVNQYDCSFVVMDRRAP